MEYTEPPTQEPDSDSEPTQEFVSARARRRRAKRRAYFPTDEAGRAALFTHLAKRAFPTYELFIFALLSGAIMGLGYFLDSQGLLFFGVLVAPILTAWIGISLGIVAGAGRLFFQTFIALLISSALIFISGLISGFATNIFPQPRTFNEAFYHSRLWPVSFFTLAIGAILITLSFVRSEQRPYLPSALVAYYFFLPICAAGFGLGSGVEGIWPQGMMVFLIHFAWATFFCIITLFHALLSHLPRRHIIHRCDSHHHDCMAGTLDRRTGLDTKAGGSSNTRTCSSPPVDFHAGACFHHHTHIYTAACHCSDRHPLPHPNADAFPQTCNR
jgi:hypothetical protein